MDGLTPEQLAKVLNSGVVFIAMRSDLSTVQGMSLIDRNGQLNVIKRSEDSLTRLAPPNAKCCPRSLSIKI